MSEPEREQYTVPPDGRPDAEQPPWRQDFPIDWPQDHYVARRDFTKFLVLTSLAFVVGQFWIGLRNLFRRRPGEWPEQRVASVADLDRAGGVLTFTYPDEYEPCILLRTGPDSFVAYGQKCTHLSCAVTPEVAQGKLRCPCHHGYFDLANGRPIQGPPRRPLPRVAIERRGEYLYATRLEERTV
ncbi:MAG: Rieske 2Fe-2S domain-containing protein [Gemmataceae bacterium]|nr:Rieske 2Fe-2S domain-containing protein [Gemmataceae bacterium]